MSCFGHTMLSLALNYDGATKDIVYMSMMLLACDTCGIDKDKVFEGCEKPKMQCIEQECNTAFYDAIYFQCGSGKIMLYNIIGGGIPKDLVATAEESADGVTWISIPYSGGGVFYPSIVNGYYRLEISCGRTVKNIAITAGTNYTYLYPCLYQVNNSAKYNVKGTITANMNDTLNFSVPNEDFKAVYTLGTTGTVGANNKATVTTTSIVGVTDTLNISIKEPSGCILNYVLTINFV